MLIVENQTTTELEKMQSEQVFGFTTSKLDAIQQVKNVTAVLVRDYAPNVVPPQVGRVWVDTVGGISYISIDTTSISDWSILGNIGGSVAATKVGIGTGSGLTSYTWLGVNVANERLEGTTYRATTQYEVGSNKVVGVRQTAAYTQDSQSVAYTGIDNLQAGTPYAQVTDLNTLRVAYEALRAGYENLRTALQTHGLIS